MTYLSHPSPYLSAGQELSLHWLPVVGAVEGVLLGVLEVPPGVQEPVCQQGSLMSLPVPSKLPVGGAPPGVQVPVCQQGSLGWLPVPSKVVVEGVLLGMQLCVCQQGSLMSLPVPSKLVVGGPAVLRVQVFDCQHGSLGLLPVPSKKPVGGPAVLGVFAWSVPFVALVQLPKLLQSAPKRSKYPYCPGWLGIHPSSQRQQFSSPQPPSKSHQLPCC